MKKTMNPGAIIMPPDTLQTTTTSPIFSFLKNPILGGTFAPVIWVTAGTVTIENVFVNSVTEACSSFSLMVGLYYATGASGTLNHGGFFGGNGGSSVGIWAENASLTHTARHCREQLFNRRNCCRESVTTGRNLRHLLT